MRMNQDIDVSHSRFLAAKTSALARPMARRTSIKRIQASTSSSDRSAFFPGGESANAGSSSYDCYRASLASKL